LIHDASALHIHVHRSRPRASSWPSGASVSGLGIVQRSSHGFRQISANGVLSSPPGPVKSKRCGGATADLG
jgi:hypothetical protein